MNIPKNILVILILIITAFASFGLGRLSVHHEENRPVLKENVYVPNTSSSTSFLSDTASFSQPAAVVASKNGTKYHYPWCSGAQRIKEGNLLEFASIEGAREAGYAPATNCKGLK